MSWLRWAALLACLLWSTGAVANWLTKGRVLSWFDSADDEDEAEIDGFAAALRHPHSLDRSFRQAMQQRQELASITLDSDESTQAVESLLHDRRRGDAEEALRFAASIDAEPLLRALTDPRFRKKEAYKGGGGKAFNAACQALEPHLRPSMIPRIAALLDDQSDAVRKRAALLLGLLADAAGLDALRRALADDSGSVCQYALIGIGRALSHTPPPSRAFLKGVFDAVAQSARRTDLGSSREGPFELMLRIDREATVAQLLSDDWLRADQPKLSELLRAFNKQRVQLDDGVLDALELALRERSGEYPHSHAYRQVLLALALNRSPGAQARIEAAFERGDDELHEHAAYALATLALGTTVESWIDAQLEAAGGKLEDSPEPVRIYADVKRYVNEVANGGHTQYLFNASGDRAEPTRQALKSIGALDAAADLDRVLSAIDGGAPTDAEGRRDRLAERIDETEALFEACDERFSGSRVRAALYRYLTAQAPA